MADTAPAIGFSVTVQLDDKRAIVAQTHVDQNAPQAYIDGVLDKVFTSIERRSLMYELASFSHLLARVAPSPPSSSDENPRR